MSKKTVIRIIAFGILIYPTFMMFQAGGALGGDEAQESENAVLNYQISAWITWAILVIVAVYDKWTKKRNTFFYYTYGFLVVAFAVWGYLHQNLVNIYDLSSRFNDSYSLGIFSALQNLFVAVVLTGILQASVWWFTRRWHRR